MAETIQDQLTSYLTDAHSIEEQAIPQMKAAPQMAGDEELAAIFRRHLTETEAQERAVRERLEARGAKPSKVKDAVMKAGGVGFALFARVKPDTPGILMSHAVSYEALEIASYELLERVAERAGDQETAATARRIRDEERSMLERLEGGFDRSVEAALRAVGAEDIQEQLTKYLADAHALEGQAIQLLERGPGIVGDAELARIFSDHLAESRGHQQAIEARLRAHGASPSKLKDAALRLGALNWAGFFAAQPDTPGKLAAFAFAFEHLEVGGYEQLRRVAERAGDQETVAAADRILREERATAEKIAAAFDRAVTASLEAQGTAA